MSNHVPIIHYLFTISSIHFLIANSYYDYYSQVLLLLKVKGNYCHDKADLKGLRSEKMRM
jgi:hypothetical protein